MIAAESGRLREGLRAMLVSFPDLEALTVVDTALRLAILLFALAFVAVLMIIVDLDRPQQGLLTVSQTALSDLLQQMTTSVQ